jgi:hypothetical protein
MDADSRHTVQPQRRWANVLSGATLCCLTLAAACPPQQTVDPPERYTAPPRPDITVTAELVFRIIVSPDAVDAPSRLLAIRLRIKSAHPRTIIFRPHWARFVLPDGTLLFAYDRPRATELMALTRLAPADPAESQTTLRREQRNNLSAEVSEQLLTQVQVEPGGTIEGYVVVDTLRPLAELAGAGVEIILTEEAGSPDPAQALHVFAPLT